jgi:hypothetical protein
VMAQWAWAYITRQRSARLITGESCSPAVRVLVHPAEKASQRQGDRERSAAQVTKTGM